MTMLAFLAVTFIAYWVYVLFFASDETLDVWGKQAEEKKRKRADLEAANLADKAARDSKMTQDMPEQLPEEREPIADAANSFEGKGGSFGGGGASGSW
jgi:hypothetical protein